MLEWVNIGYSSEADTRRYLNGVNTNVDSDSFYDMGLEIDNNNIQIYLGYDGIADEPSDFYHGMVKEIIHYDGVDVTYATLCYECETEISSFCDHHNDKIIN